MNLCVCLSYRLSRCKLWKPVITIIPARALMWEWGVKQLWHFFLNSVEVKDMICTTVHLPELFTASYYQQHILAGVLKSLRHIRTSYWFALATRCNPAFSIYFNYDFIQIHEAHKCSHLKLYFSYSSTCKLLQQEVLCVLLYHIMCDTTYWG